MWKEGKEEKTEESNQNGRGKEKEGVTKNSREKFLEFFANSVYSTKN